MICTQRKGDNSMSNRFIAVTMSKNNFLALLHGKDGKNGLKTREGVINYINQTWGLLGEVVDIKIED